MARLVTVAVGALLALLGASLINTQVSSAQTTGGQQGEETKSVSSKTVKVPMYYQPPSTEQTPKVASRATLKTRRCGYLTYIIRDGGGSNYALQTYGFKSSGFRDYYQMRFTLNIRQNKSARHPGWEKFWGGYHLFEAAKQMYWTRNQWVPKSNHRYHGSAYIKLYIVPNDGGGTCYGNVYGASGYVT